MSTEKTIFIVDDNKSNLVVASDALSDLYKVFTFTSGARMFKVLEKLMPDIILLDVLMPEMNGYDVIKLLKEDERFCRIPVIFLTALDNPEKELEGLNLGALDYITKPFSVPLLQKRIDLHLQLFDYHCNLEGIVEEKTKEVVALRDTVIRTTAELMEYRGKNVGNHIARTKMYVGALINAMTQNDVYANEIAELGTDLVLQSSQLHDVGMISISDTILLKEDSLTSEEFDLVKEHTDFGEMIIERMKEGGFDNEFLDYASIFVAYHHEKWDGTGYPKGLAGHDIPLLGRIMAIADVYDALVSERPYKKALSHDAAVAVMLDGRGTHFDPAIIDIFEKIHHEFEKISIME